MLGHISVEIVVETVDFWSLNPDLMAHVSGFIHQGGLVSLSSTASNKLSASIPISSSFALKTATFSSSCTRMCCVKNFLPEVLQCVHQLRMSAVDPSWVEGPLLKRCRLFIATMITLMRRGRHGKVNM